MIINDGLDSDDVEKDDDEDGGEDVGEDIGGVDDENLGGDEQTIALEESNLFLVHKNQHLKKRIASILLPSNTLEVSEQDQRHLQWSQGGSPADDQVLQGDGGGFLLLHLHHHLVEAVRL